PYLTGELAIPFIDSLQGNDSKYLKTIATAKHFAVHSGPEALRHEFNVNVSDRDLYETYLPAFRKAVKDAHVYSIMGAYNRFRGHSCSGDTFLLNQVLRNTWGFEGYVVSDCGAIRDIHTGHHIANNEAEAAAIGLKGGCDLNCGSYYKNLKEALDSELITENDINVALHRLMLARFKMGMFDPDSIVPYASIPSDIICSSANTTLARKAAQESIVLLKNEGNILPLDKNKVKSIAIIGPNADNWESLVGNYHGTPKNPVTFLNGLQNKVGSKIDILYAEGSNLSDKALNLRPIPSINLQAKDGQQGLSASYYTNTKSEGNPVLIRIDDEINFWWEQKPISKNLIDNFSVKWEGYLIPDVTGEYEIGGFAKRGIAIHIKGKEITNGNGSVHHGQYATDTLHLEAGRKYPITVTYFSDASNAHVQLLWTRTDKDKLNEAVLTAEKADISVIVLGLSQRIEGEGGDRKNIELPEQQMKLLKAIEATGKPIILVLNAGSALAINWAKDNIEGILSVGYPGEEGGNAFADVLFGDYNPAGRLPITYYTSLDELPPFEDYNMTNRTYRYYKGIPLYSFGYGLSYTHFEYSNLNIPPHINAGDSLDVSVEVKNTGNRAGDEVVQLYIKDIKASTPRPLCQLEGFERIHIKAGDSKTVHFTLSPRQLSMINKQSKRVIEAGDFIIFVGGNQPKTNNTEKFKDNTIQKTLKLKGNMTFSKE
ncbi:MAG: glycoside hydrolase family 3 C-terminal domain-containing protein, partial [Bacteroidales bacterium]|nr:glycoside hydrolase family 3 C-terminal domain-containing protein [Bacteroidales bacterium]